MPRTEQLAERSRELLARPDDPAAQRQVVGPGGLAAAERLHADLPRVPEPARELAARLHLPDRQADRAPVTTAATSTRTSATSHGRWASPWRRGGSPSAPGPRSGITTTSRPWRAKLEPPGKHDACFLPRTRHFTGDIQIHEMAFAQGELWFVTTRFSCLRRSTRSTASCRAGGRRSSPRWPPEDRCHLNGLCVVDDQPRYVTALGATDDAGGWRDEQDERRRADGRRDAARSSLRGLSMPHSPRWYDGRLWVLESGKGTVSVADLDTGTVETVAELPGFTRGLLFAGGWPSSACRRSARRPSSAACR